MAAVMEEKALLGLREVALLLCSTFALFMLIALITFSNEDAGWSHSGSEQAISNACGMIGAWLSDIILSLFGLMGYLFPLMLAWIGYLIYRDKFHPDHIPIVIIRYVGFIFTIAFGTASLYLHMPRVEIELPGGTGGVLGQELGDLSVILLGNSGATLSMLVGALIGVTLFTDFSWIKLMDSLGKYTLLICRFIWQPLDVLELILLKYKKEAKPIARQSQTRHSVPKAKAPIERSEQTTVPKVKIAPQIKEDLADPIMQPSTEPRITIIRTPELKLSESEPSAIRFSSTPEPQKFVKTPVQLDDEDHFEGEDHQSVRSPQHSTLVKRESPKDPVRIEPTVVNTSREVKSAFHDEEDFDDEVLMVPDYPGSVDEEPEMDDYADYEAQLNHEKIHYNYQQPAPIAIKQTVHEQFKTQPTESKLKITHYEGPVHSNSSRSFGEFDSVLPDLSLLDERENRVNGYSDDDLEAMSRLVEEVLQDFNVVVEVVAVHPGPVITRFELQPAAGVKVSRISGLSKDLARALSVTSVRIVEIIPGKSVIGLEIPNQEREMVNLRELLISPVFKTAKSILTLALGKDIAGDPVVADLGKMPHALVAGTTGSGKSVAINTMILSLLYKATPEQVRMILIDPKMLELSVYEGIPHLLTPVVTDMKEAQNALRWAVGEMERRYKLMSKMGVRNLAGFNGVIEAAAGRGEAIRDPMFQYDKPLGDDVDFPVLSTLPSIVIVIDELADMMMIVGKKVEELIARLAQKARAAGIHLILATQRPSVDVLTGLIKANVPTRISFQVSSRIDSRTIIDQGGAETLLGNGDMLYQLAGTSIPIRAHGAFVDDHEVHRVVEFLKQTAPPNYLEEITRESSESGENNGGFGGDDSETDPLYDQAVMFITETRKASISSVQRKFKIGYNRAARIIEDMEASGVVSPPESNGYREVLAPAAPRAG